MVEELAQREVDPGLWVSRGPFGRPVITSATPRAPLSPAALRLQAVNEARLEARAQGGAGAPHYFILVPTLRCNIRCDYCQVSRVAETARGFDWTDEIADRAIDFIAGCAAEALTLEFQGGEPLLRLDLIQRVRSALIARGKRVKTVICTNLQHVDEAAWAFFAEPDVLVSSSFDGTWEAHDRLRTQDAGRLESFRANLSRALRDLGPDRVSLVSTIDPLSAPEPAEILAAATALGVATLFVRPVNYQGFARKAFAGARADTLWDSYYQRFLDTLIAANAERSLAVSEYYFSYILRRILDPRQNAHVDLRNPAPLGKDYMVIGERGDIFPTDEARMLHRTGQVDLRIGHVATGLDAGTIALLNTQSDNRTDPDCRACVYQAVCGRDLVDDLSRYGRVDGPRHETRHCQRHMAIFDYTMRRLARADAQERDTLARMAGLAGLRSAAYEPAHV